MMDDKIKRLIESQDPSNYFKLKFDGGYNPYTHYIWISLFSYVNGYVVSEEDFVKIVSSVQVSQPTNMKLEEVYERMHQHQWLELQDNSGKYMYGPEIELRTQPYDMLLVLGILSLDRVYKDVDDFLHSGEKDSSELIKIANGLADGLVSLNGTMRGTMIRILINTKGEFTESFNRFSQIDSNFVNHARYFRDNVLPFAFWDNEELKEIIDTSVLFEALYTIIRIMKGYCMMTCLDALFFTSMLSDMKYQREWLNIWSFVRHNLHNGYVYRIELATIPENKSIPVSERGSMDHTTRCKIYAFDIKRTPILIRIDLPHKGEGNEQKLHINISSTSPEILNDDHYEIGGDDINIGHFIDSFRDMAIRLCPNILHWADTYADDDKKVFDDMLLFNQFDDLCTAYFCGQKDSPSLHSFCQALHKSAPDLSTAIFEGYCYFIDRE